MKSGRQGWTTEARATVSLAFPLILTNVAQSLIQATDLLLLGRIGSRALAAGALGNNLVMVAMVFGIGLVTAVSPLLSRERGARRHAVRELRRTVRQGFWVSLAAVIPMWLALWHADRLLVLLGQEPALAADAALFVRAMMWGLLPTFFYMVLRGFVAALERSVWAMVVGLAAVVANAVVNYGLILGHFGLPRLGLVGAGIGSALSALLMFLGLAVIVTRHRAFRRYRLFGRWWRADWPRFVRILELGLPIALMLLLEVAAFSGAIFLMGLIGADAVAAHAVALQIAALSFMVPLGLSQAVTVRVGLALGRADRAGVTRAGWTAFVIGVGFMGLMALVMVLMPERLIGLFLATGDPANARVLPLAVSFLMLAALFQVVDGAQAVGAGMLRGLQDTAVPLVFAVIGYWIVGLPFGALLAFRLGWDGVGIWTGLATGLAAVAVLVVWRWTRRDRLGLTPA